MTGTLGIGVMSEMSSGHHLAQPPLRTADWLLKGLPPRRSSLFSLHTLSVPLALSWPATGRELGNTKPRVVLTEGFDYPSAGLDNAHSAPKVKKIKEIRFK